MYYHVHFCILLCTCINHSINNYTLHNFGFVVQGNRINILVHSIKQQNKFEVNFYWFYWNWIPVVLSIRCCCYRIKKNVIMKFCVQQFSFISFFVIVYDGIKCNCFQCNLGFLKNILHWKRQKKIAFIWHDNYSMSADSFKFNILFTGRTVFYFSC